MTGVVRAATTAPDLAARFEGLTRERARLRAQANAWLFGVLYLVSAIRAVLPIWRKGNATYVMGYDDVRRVLFDDRTFAIPFGERMAALDSGGQVSVLGLPDDREYQKNLRKITQVLKLERLPALSESIAARAGDIVKRHAAGLDAVTDLLLPIAIETAQDIFGFRFEDPAAFYRWAMTISNYTFASGEPASWLKEAATIASRLVDAELDKAIGKVKQTRQPAGTILADLAAMTEPDGKSSLTDGQIRATVAGLLTGMLPNLPISGYNVLLCLMSRPEALRMARAAALENDDELLGRCIVEALRFRPIDLFRRRQCVANTNFVRSGAAKPVQIPRGREVYAVTLSAMFDGRRVNRPYRFDPSRPRSDNLAFGDGKHWCVGAPLAICILTQALKPLLRRHGIRRKPGLFTTRYFVGFFPDSLPLLFDRAGL